MASKVKEYIKLKVKADEIKQEMDELKDEIVAEVLGTDEKEIVTDEAKVFLGRSIKYKYSKKVDLKEEEVKAEKEILKIMKKDEEETGKAKVAEEKYFPKVKFN